MWGGGRLVWEVGSWVCEGRLVSVCRGLIWGGCGGGGRLVWEAGSWVCEGRLFGVCRGLIWGGCGGEVGVVGE